MNYRQTLDYLFAQLPMFQRIGAAAYRADLSNTIALCDLLDHPEHNFKSIHIAGTNGKGSTSHLISAILQSAGYKTGLYTSPHLIDFRERIRINGKKIPKNYVTNFVIRNIKRFGHVQPSFFEYTAVMAFQYFSDEKVDIAIIETGMGGRLDSTNVINPLISVITNISKDHTAFLGNSLTQIAGEKAGIIKDGVPVVIGETQKEIQDIFITRAKTMKSTISFADQQYRISKIARRKFTIFLKDPVSSAGDNISILPAEITISCPLEGTYQEKNLITTYQVIKQLIEIGFSIGEKDIQSGLKNVIKLTDLQGRWQVIAKTPRTICDVGHNESGISHIIEQLEKEKFESLHWVFGLVNDKDTESILKLMPSSARYYFCKANIPRGMEAGELAIKARAFGLKGKSFPSVKEAFHAAKTAAKEDDLVFIGGSTFIVAEVL